MSLGLWLLQSLDPCSPFPHHVSTSLCLSSIKRHIVAFRARKIQEKLLLPRSLISSQFPLKVEATPKVSGAGELAPGVKCVA